MLLVKSTIIKQRVVSSNKHRMSGIEKSLLSIITTELLSGMDAAVMSKLVPRLVDHLVSRGHDRRKISMDVKDFFTNPSSMRSEEGLSVMKDKSVIIITDYADTCMAIIGDVSTIEAGIISLNDHHPGCTHQNSRLAYGPGWLVQSFLLGTIKNMLYFKSIPYKLMTASKYSESLL